LNGKTLALPFGEFEQNPRESPWKNPDAAKRKGALTRRPRGERRVLNGKLSICLSTQFAETLDRNLRKLESAICGNAGRGMACGTGQTCRVQKAPPERGLITERDRSFAGARRARRSPPEGPWPLDHVESDSLPLGERSEALHLDLTEVDEEILPSGCSMNP